MEQTEEDDYCLPEEAAQSRQHDDLRIMAELNNPRIYVDVKHVLRQEQRIKRAIARNKSLPFPCKCGQLCEFGDLLATLYNAFEKLYDEYSAVHEQYTNIFQANAFVVSGRKVHVQNEMEEFDSPKGMIAPVKTNVSDLASDSGLLENRKKALADEDLWRKTYELHMECVRLNMLRVAKPREDRFIDWLRSHIWGYRKCSCYHCDYRDALVAYRRALLSLHVEYLSLYASYYALLSSIRVEDGDDSAKTLRLREEDAEIVRNILTEEQAFPDE
ncbi:unnamed protein product [Calicophoron daubneyi]|uniref:Uncharacterized protein n=1 Tax=Calicophoron daubneyi TaxID=300641 RepID=A0AAV2TK56_CALDB